jgi:prepilin-type N-terminal cleavage/methylation domain-containing protein
MSLIARLARRFALRLRCERGFTLIEMLVAMALGLVVIGLPMIWIVTSLTQQNVVASRSAAARQAEQGLERLTRDLRQVAPSSQTTFSWTASSATVTMSLPRPGTQGVSTDTVVWQCSFGDSGYCNRSVNSGTAQKLIANVESIAFAVKDATGNSVASDQTSPAPAFAGITLSVLNVSQLDNSSTPSHSLDCIRGASSCVTPSTHYVTVQDGVDLRANSL